MDDWAVHMQQHCKRNLKIYVMTHKAFEAPKDEMYVPLQVGSALHPKLGYLRDDTGDNISLKNPYYAELSGMYWVWKNDTASDYVGLCHYRRYLIGPHNRTFSAAEYEELLGRYDVIASKKVVLDNSYYDGYAAAHYQRDMDVTAEVIRELYPDYYDTFCRLVHENKAYLGNIFVTGRAVFDRYAGWLFDIFSEVEKRTDFSAYDAYQQRVFGFLSEFLQYVWITVNGLSVYECRVGLIGEKFETGELKRDIAGYLSSGDIDGAKEYFAKALKRRPDLLMEASDTTGELAAAMQAVVIADYERAAGKETLLHKGLDFEAVVEAVRQLNKAVDSGKASWISAQYDGLISREALEVTQKLHGSLQRFYRRWEGTDDKD